jgi:hypothetical protein
MTASDGLRRAELVKALGAVRARISAACAGAGRDPRSVHLIAVTKTFPAADVATLAELGVLDFGESRDQEATAKVAEIANQLGASSMPRWHFVGRVQSRKCASVVRYADVVHSVDRAELVTRLASAVEAVDRGPLEVLVQLSVDGDPERGGVVAEQMLALADEVAGCEQLRLRGVMAIAPIAAEPDGAFAAVAAASQRLRQHHPEASWISAGMSNDFESAVAHGATHVRVGSALLGRRTSTFG